MPNNLNVLWADADLEGLDFAYDHVDLRVRESTGHKVTVRADGQIGLKICGFWDEAIVASGTVVDDHPFANECRQALVERLGSARPKSGSPGRNLGSFTTLVVSLIDGCQVICVAADFIAERHP